MHAMRGEFIAPSAATLLFLAVNVGLLQRLVQAYRKSRSRAHIVLFAGFVTSGLTSLSLLGCMRIASGTPPDYDSLAWRLCRGGGLVFGGLALGLLAVFAAVAFRKSSARALLIAWLDVVALVALGFVASATEPLEYLSWAQVHLSVRVPYVVLGVFSAGWPGIEALSLERLLRRAAKHSKSVDPVALGRMRVFGWALVTFALAQLPLFTLDAGMTFEPRAALVSFSFFGGAAIALIGCYVAWATPVWLKRRWRAV
jgi:hypothetical protein